ncbi:putative A ORF A [Vaccinia virus Copenhagen]|uniref:Uncharacterized 14.1 kDa protein n=3 Tax=Vaccinia virus TaxID=10245 RepID=YVAA_VACCC|nr:RecName: Full=Uncharacterized 14.1 kDa protein [Vaccinia virus Copenhagen]AAF33992.1 unknown [Vaccinia virus Tian Tan]AGJ91302.1 hypothetical protein VACV_TT8_153 [Vaccinia virus]AAA48119.1 putative A ORF A [Vaccinia virus Copenhagen]AGJ91845.1 hypothetical protein VACV_TT10_153 [Vaccinia virus]AGJ92392.1 hypothetical protein VACV_TT12_153 [Vaccinia virus]
MNSTTHHISSQWINVCNSRTSSISYVRRSEHHSSTIAIECHRINILGIDRNRTVGCCDHLHRINNDVWCRLKFHIVTDAVYRSSHRNQRRSKSNYRQNRSQYLFLICHNLRASSMNNLH